jgi:DNA replicative helicase MCM subunit Mcm2 (Cdc46/Mcm family)
MLPSQDFLKFRDYPDVAFACNTDLCENNISNHLDIAETSMGSIHRNLYVDFDRYGVSNDDHKKEMARETIENLKEVQDAILEALQTNSLDLFSKICQKIKSALARLDDRELSDSLRAVNSEFFDKENKNSAISNLIFVCSHIITRVRQAKG